MPDHEPQVGVLTFHKCVCEPYLTVFRFVIHGLFNFHLVFLSLFFFFQWFPINEMGQSCKQFFYIENVYYQKDQRDTAGEVGKVSIEGNFIL